jgi:hypothetical protein
MAGFALVSTVDSMGPDFPGHCVMLFDTEEDAVKHAVQLIRVAEETEGDSVLVLDGEKYETPEEFLDAFQRSLSYVEYFHVMPIVPSTIE